MIMNEEVVVEKVTAMPLQIQVDIVQVALPEWIVWIRVQSTIHRVETMVMNLLVSGIQIITAMNARAIMIVENPEETDMKAPEPVDRRDRREFMNLLVDLLLVPLKDLGRLIMIGISVDPREMSRIL